MALIPHASLQSRVNDAVLRTLSNAAGEIAGRPGVVGIFNESSGMGGDLGMMVQGTVIIWVVSPSNVPADWSGVPVLITEGVGLGEYRIVQAEPDSGGLTRLVLEVATS